MDEATKLHGVASHNLRRVELEGEMRRCQERIDEIRRIKAVDERS
jgi:hypothetical protein